MAGEVLNIKICNLLKLFSGLTRKCHAICHYSTNLPLYRNLKTSIVLSTKPDWFDLHHEDQTSQVLFN